MDGKYQSCKNKLLGNIGEMRRIFAKIVNIVDSGGSVEVKKNKDGTLKIYQVQKRHIELAD